MKSIDFRKIPYSEMSTADRKIAILNRPMLFAQAYYRGKDV